MDRQRSPLAVTESPVLAVLAQLEAVETAERGRLRGYNWVDVWARGPRRLDATVQEGKAHRRRMEAPAKELKSAIDGPWRPTRKRLATPEGC